MRDPQDAGESLSKSELKRQSRGLQDLGWALVELPEAELAAIAMPDELLDAVRSARRIVSHGARARQRLYIGKLLRNIDPEPIREALARRGAIERQRLLQEKSIEQWRDRLLADDPAAWSELAGRADAHLLQQCRALVRQARAERTSARPPAAARQLFRRLRQALGEG
jgi:ribosome-associated protein